jgi:hypothetical protein
MDQPIQREPIGGKIFANLDLMIQELGFDDPGK